MTPEERRRYQQIRTVFLKARDLTGPARAAYLAEACAGDAGIQAAVERYLADEAEATAFLESIRLLDASQQAELPAGRQPMASSPKQVGRYRILRKIGAGGMGVVYEAEQDRPQRMVALKIVRPGGATSAQLRRLELEAEVLGRLQHPGIAQVYEAGMAKGKAGPLPYFVMELIRGRTLTEHVKERQLTLRQRLELFAQICDAVQHAHQKGVIHRDLKPGNILVTDEGQPKILDFGVARITDSDLQVTTVHTDIGQLIGTIPYMSPEQVAGDVRELDTRSDVYALGVVLYELLSGRLPHDLSRRMIPEAVRVIREDEPTRLSSISRTFRGDVETIVGKALEKEKERRYPSAAALASDIRHYLSDEPISARPPSAAYQLRKFAKRNKAMVGGVVAVFTVLLAGIIASTLLYVRAETHRQRAVLAEREQSRQRERAEKALAAETTARDEAEAARAEERRRADELKLVANFQAEQLSGIDVPTMAARLRSGLLEQLRKTGERSRLEEEEIAQRAAAFEQLLAGTDLTGLSLKLLDENIFGRALTAIDKQFADQPLVKARLLQAVANVLRGLGLLDGATAPQTEALAIRRRILGNDHADTLTSINSMGELLQTRGALEEAEPYCREAMENRRRVLGDEHRDTLTSIDDMGHLLLAQGKLAEAEPYLREAMENRRRVLSDDCPDILFSLSNMGGLLVAQNKPAEAEPYFREALDSSRRMLGEDHQGTLAAIGNVGYLLSIQGKWAEAEPYYREALEKRRRVLGDYHPETITAIGNMGVLLFSHNKLSEAEPYYREALEKRRRVLGDDHPETLLAIGNLGGLLQSQGKLAEAEPYLHEVIERRRRALGDDHQETLTAIFNMGYLLQAQGKPAEAEPYHREVLEKRRRLLGDDHPDTLASISSIGGLLLAQGKLAEAEPYYREALEKRRRVLGDDHRLTLRSIGNMGVLLEAQGKAVEAEPYYREALERRRRILGDDHQDTLLAISNMGYILQAQGRLAEAEPYIREALERRRRLLGDDHPDTLTSINNMGALLQAQDKLAEAEQYYREALEKRRRVLGNDHPETLLSIGNMGALLFLQDKLTEAEPYYREALERCRRVLGDDHTDTLRAITNMGGLLFAQGQSGKAIALLATAEPAARRAFTGSHAVWLGRFVSILGRSRLAAGAFDEAETNLTEAQAILSEAKGGTPKHREYVLTGLAELYEAWHAAEPGKGYDQKAVEWRAKLEAGQAATQPTATQPAANELSTSQAAAESK